MISAETSEFKNLVFFHRSFIYLRSQPLFIAKFSLSIIENSEHAILQELKSQLLSMLDDVPPESPDPVVIDMLLAVSSFDDYLEDKISQGGGLDSPRVYPLEIFSGFVDEWIQGFVVSPLKIFDFIKSLLGLLLRS